MKSIINNSNKLHEQKSVHTRTQCGINHKQQANLVLDVVVYVDGLCNTCNLFGVICLAVNKCRGGSTGYTFVMTLPFDIKIRSHATVWRPGPELMSTGKYGPISLYSVS